jgi:hypothetical protein
MTASGPEWRFQPTGLTSDFWERTGEHMLADMALSRTSLRGGTAGGSLVPSGTGFLRTACRATAIVLEKIVKIFSSVVEGNFFPQLDTARCDDYDSAVASNRLRIRSTGMINVARQIPSGEPSMVHRLFIVNIYISRRAPRAARLLRSRCAGRDRSRCSGRAGSASSRIGQALLQSGRHGSNLKSLFAVIGCIPRCH